jgi:hypothetical protein
MDAWRIAPRLRLTPAMGWLRSFPADEVAVQI